MRGYQPIHIQPCKYIQCIKQLIHIKGDGLHFWTLQRHHRSRTHTEPYRRLNTLINIVVIYYVSRMIGAVLRVDIDCCWCFAWHYWNQSRRSASVPATIPRDRHRFSQHIWPARQTLHRNLQRRNAQLIGILFFFALYVALDASRALELRTCLAIKQAYECPSSTEVEGGTALMQYKGKCHTAIGQKQIIASFNTICILSDLHSTSWFISTNVFFITKMRYLFTFIVK